MFNEYLPDYVLAYLRVHGYEVKSVNLINEEDDEQVILNSEGLTFWNIPDEDLPYQYDYAQMPAKLLWFPRQDELKGRVNRDAEWH